MASVSRHATRCFAGEEVANIWGLFTERVPRRPAPCWRALPRSRPGWVSTIFLVGGAVRDVLLGSENIDLDILVEGESIPLAQAVGTQLGGAVVEPPEISYRQSRVPG